MSGADIANPPSDELHVIRSRTKGRADRIIAAQKAELSMLPQVADARQQAPSRRAEEKRMSIGTIILIILIIALLGGFSGVGGGPFYGTGYYGGGGLGLIIVILLILILLGRI
jgi:hypothetical protein